MKNISMKIISKFKLNNYQKVILSWGSLVFLGHIITYYATSTTILLVSWTVVIAIAVFVQVMLMWYEKKVGILTHLTWLFVVITGSVLTYMIYFGRIYASIQMTAMWFLVCTVGMLITAYLQKNSSYVLLAVFYLMTAVMFQFLIGHDDIILSGVMFLFLSILDTVLEYSPLRNPMLKTGKAIEPKTFKELRKLEEKEQRFSDEIEIEE